MGMVLEFHRQRPQRSCAAWSEANHKPRPTSFPWCINNFGPSLNTTCGGSVPITLCRPQRGVHEASLRLVRLEDPTWQSRAHFFAAASRVMRYILVDYGHGGRRAKRSDNPVKVPLRESYCAAEERPRRNFGPRRVRSLMRDRSAAKPRRRTSLFWWLEGRRGRGGRGNLGENA